MLPFICTDVNTTSFKYINTTVFNKKEKNKNMDLSNIFLLRKKCPNTKLFMVGIFLYSVRLQKNADQT